MSNEIKINRHIEDYDCQTTFEVECKNLLYSFKSNVENEDYIEEFFRFDYETGHYTNKYGDKCYNEIVSSLNFIDIKDWCFGGRSNGWYVLLSDCDYNIEDMTEDEQDEYWTDITTIEEIVYKYKKEYKDYMEELLELNYKNIENLELSK